MEGQVGQYPSALVEDGESSGLRLLCMELVILELYGDNGKENGNYHIIIGV